MIFSLGHRLVFWQKKLNRETCLDGLFCFVEAKQTLELVYTSLEYTWEGTIIIISTLFHPIHFPML